MMLSGGHPWAGITEQEALAKHQSHSLPHLSKVNKSIPISLADWIDYLTQADPLRRPRNARAALEALPALDEIVETVVEGDQTEGG